MGTRLCEIAETVAEQKQPAAAEVKSSDRRCCTEVLRLSVRLDDQLSGALSQECEKSGKTPSEVVRDALRRELEPKLKSVPKNTEVTTCATASPESRAIARALAQKRKPKLSRDDQDALALYGGHIYLRADTDPDSWFLANAPAYRRCQELHQIQGEHVDNARWHEHVNRSTEASLHFELAFGREPKPGEILRFTDVEASCANSLLIIADFIEAWRRQIPDTHCPLKIENGVLYRNHKQQKITTWTQEGGWKTEEGGGWQVALDKTAEWNWREVEECAVGDHKHMTTPLDKIPTIHAVVFGGMADGKHTCKPATKDEVATLPRPAER